MKGETLYLRRFAGMLGWRSIHAYEHIVRDSLLVASGLSLIRWYESGSLEDILLQINLVPDYRAAVYAIRYKLCTGWHKFTLHKERDSLQQEADRVRKWLARSWFTSQRMRQRFRELHPECSGYSMKRLREAGPPYE